MNTFCTRTKLILDNLDRSELRYKDQNCEVIYPEEKSIIALKNDAKTRARVTPP